MPQEVMMRNEVRLRRDGQEQVIYMQNAPRVGGVLVVSGEPWLVMSVSYLVGYRIPRVSLIAR
jgi:hypothetical protein